MASQMGAVEVMVRSCCNKDFKSARIRVCKEAVGYSSHRESNSSRFPEWHEMETGTFIDC